MTRQEYLESLQQEVQQLKAEIHEKAVAMEIQKQKRIKFFGKIIIVPIMLVLIFVYIKQESKEVNYNETELEGIKEVLYENVAKKFAEIEEANIDPKIEKVAEDSNRTKDLETQKIIQEQENEIQETAETNNKIKENVQDKQGDGVEKPMDASLPSMQQESNYSDNNDEIEEAHQISKLI